MNSYNNSSDYNVSREMFSQHFNNSISNEELHFVFRPSVNKNVYSSDIVLFIFFTIYLINSLIITVFMLYNIMIIGIFLIPMVLVSAFFSFGFILYKRTNKRNIFFIVTKNYLGIYNLQNAKFSVKTLDSITEIHYINDSKGLGAIIFRFFNTRRLINNIGAYSINLFDVFRGGMPSFSFYDLENVEEVVNILRSKLNSEVCFKKH